MVVSCLGKKTIFYIQADCKRHETIDKNYEPFCFLLYKLCCGVSMSVTETGQMPKFREIVKSPDWSLLIMRAIRGRLFKGIFAVISGCLIIVISFEKFHPGLLPVCFENIAAVSRLLGTLMSFHVDSYCLSHAFFSRWRKVSSRNCRGSCPFLARWAPGS